MNDDDTAARTLDSPTQYMPTKPAPAVELAWSDETPTGTTKSERRPMPYALTGLLVAVLICAIGLASYVIGTGHTPPPLRILVAPPTTKTVAPPPVSVPPPLKTVTPEPTVTPTVALPPVAPPVTSPAMDPRDEQFLERVAQAGLSFDNPKQGVASAKTVCPQFDHGVTYGDMLIQVHRNAPTLSTQGARDYIAAVVATWCPRYARLLDETKVD